MKVVPGRMTYSLAALLTAAVASLVPSSTQAAELSPVACEGNYAKHLQGVCVGSDAIYWCFTTQLVKTDLSGKVLKQIPVGDHHGDLCFHDGKVYVGVNFGKFNRPEGAADSWVYVYAADDLSLVAKHATPQLVHGAGGIAWHDGKFLVVGGLPPGSNENYAYEYDADFRFVRRHVLNSGYTLMGIQTAAFADGHWWFGCYGDPKTLLKADAVLQKVERFEFDCSLGIVPLEPGRFLIARGTSSKERGCTGRLVSASVEPKRGLALTID